MNPEDLKPWQAVLEKLGRDVGLGGLMFTEEGYCSLALDNGRILHLQIEEEGLTLMTVLGEATTGERRAQVLESLLGANAFWIGTQGATLALDADLRQVLLMRRETLDVLEGRGLKQVLGELIEASERWAARLDGAAQDSEIEHGGGRSTKGIRV